MIDQQEYVLVKNLAAYPCNVGRFGLFGPAQERKVPVDFVAEYGMAPQFAIDYSPLKEQFRSRMDDGRPVLDWWCPLSAIDGYGRHALSIYQGLQQLGAEPILRATQFVDEKYLNSALIREAHDSRKRLPSKVGVSMTLPYDPYLYDHGSAIKIALTQFETDHMPRKHVANINKCDHLIVTSTFQPSMMRRSGVTIPIDVMTAGVDTAFFEPRERPRDGTFKCLILGALTGRKNPLGAIWMFQQAFKGNPDVRLTIKTRRADGVARFLEELGFPILWKEEIDNETGTVRRIAPLPQPWQGTAPHDPRITVILNDDPPQAVRDYYYDHDCLIWPSKGEGCGLPALEALACGMEVVSSNNSGLGDFIADGWAWPIKNAGMERADGEGGFSQDYVEKFGEVGRWWVPDLKHGSKQLARCFDAWRQGRGKGQAAAAYVRDAHTLAAQARSVLRVVERYL